jgi:hypothetical protein
MIPAGDAVTKSPTTIREAIPVLQDLQVVSVEPSSDPITVGNRLTSTNCGGTSIASSAGFLAVRGAVAVVMAKAAEALAEGFNPT